MIKPRFAHFQTTVFLRLSKLYMGYMFGTVPTPKPNNRNVLITAALPYVNNTPHLGNIIGAILSGDTYARYCRMRGYNTLFICGTDEYGTTTQVKALKQSVSPKQICDRYHAMHKDVYNWFQIGFDYFGRTTDPVHSQLTTQIFKALQEKGYAQKKSVMEFYCEKCKISLADRYVIGKCKNCGSQSKGDQCDNCSLIFSNPIKQLHNPKCSICSSTPTITQTNQLFFKLSKCQQGLKRQLLPENSSEKGMRNWSNNAKAVTKAWLNTGLEDRCISRSLNWGVPVPQQYLTGNKVFYVWFQAPIGYISITKAILGQKWKEWWMPNPQHNVQLTQFMGKDNIAFHSIMFPATLQSTSLPYIKPHRLSVTEYLLYEGGKFSKSNNIGIFGDDCAKTGIKSDVWRYYLLLSRPQVFDTQFLWKDLSTVNKKDLINTLGNMFLRILKYIYSNLKNEIPQLNISKYTKEQQKLIQDFSEAIKKYCELMENVQIKSGCHSILQMGQILNKYMQDCQFWSKKNVDQGRNLLVVGLALRVLQFYAILIQPYIPGTTQAILNTVSLTPQTALRFPTNIQPDQYFKNKLLNPEQIESENKRWRQLKLKKPEIFFEDISDKRLQELKKMFGVNRKNEKQQIKSQAENKEQKNRKAQKKAQRKQMKLKRRVEKKQKRQHQEYKQKQVDDPNEKQKN